MKYMCRLTDVAMAEGWQLNNKHAPCYLPVVAFQSAGHTVC